MLDVDIAALNLMTLASLLFAPPAIGRSIMAITSDDKLAEAERQLAVIRADHAEQATQFERAAGSDLGVRHLIRPSNIRHLDRLIERTEELLRDYDRFLRHERKTERIARTLVKRIGHEQLARLDAFAKKWAEHAAEAYKVRADAIVWLKALRATADADGREVVAVVKDKGDPDRFFRKLVA